jgi:glycosyltransferase involved in cell wall biosynthesis
MKYSFVIPSYDRKDILERCIHSIERAYEVSEAVEIEILIVFCAINIIKSSFNLKYPDLTVTQYVKQNIISRAKNRGIERASGEYIILIDDDTTIKDDFIVTLNHLLDDEGNRSKIICPIIRDPISHACNTRNEEYMPRKYLGRVDYNIFRGPAIIIEKNVLKQAGMFSEEFGPGGTYAACEESDLYFRIKMLDEKVLFIPELIAYHPTVRIMPEDKIYRYSFATGALLTKYAIKDWPHMVVYLFLIIKILAICLIRIAQVAIFPKQMTIKDQQHRYYIVLKGIIKGISNYCIRSLLSKTAGY